MQVRLVPSVFIVWGNVTEMGARSVVFGGSVTRARTAKHDANEVECTYPPRWKTSTRTQHNGLDTEITTDTKGREHTQPIAKAHQQ